MDGPLPGGLKPAGFFYGGAARSHEKALLAHRRQQRWSSLR
jgi:hypothetical protein